MNFNLLQPKVYSLTKRPDLEAITRIALTGALRLLMRDLDSVRDMEETEYAIDPSDVNGSIRVGIDRIFFVKPRNRNVTLIPISANRAFINNRARQDVYYLRAIKIPQATGSNDNIIYTYDYELVYNLKIPAEFLLVGSAIQVIDPNQLETNDYVNHPLELECPELLLFKAASTVFSSIGNPTEAAKMEASYQQLMIAHRTSERHGIKYG